MICVVSFGSVRTAAHGQAITRAVIEIERFSSHSIKARFCMFDADGEIVATFEDCRFRRTWLRKHASLESASFHYEAVASNWNERAPAALPVGPRPRCIGGTVRQPHLCPPGGPLGKREPGC